MNESTSSSFAVDDIQNVLPSDWKYKILNKVVFGSPQKLEVCIKVALFTPEEVQLWVEALEEKVQCCYSIQGTRRCAGEKVLFKRRFRCQHKTRDKNLYHNSKTGSRNTNCPSRLSISLMRIQKKYRGKNPPDPSMPCIIDYVVTHNHTPDLSARFRRVNKAVQDKLKQLFSVGYNASTAHEYIKVDLQLNNPENYEELIVNRSICPDRNYCHRWYNIHIREYGTIDSKDKTFLFKRLEEYNMKMGEVCAKIEFAEEDFVIVLCPPLFKRIHTHIKASSEVVFMAAINPADNDGSKAFFLLTHSECGTLPLGIIFTSAEDPQLVVRGLEILRGMIGNTMFFGRQDGPRLFVVDDCEAEQIALNTLWPQSNVLFCGLHILNSIWRYLLCTKNGIPRNIGLQFFNKFRQIMVATTQEECDLVYEEALSLAAEHEDYLKVLQAYWERKDMWTVGYRRQSLHEKYKHVLTIENSKTSSSLLNEPIFQDDDDPLLGEKYKHLFSTYDLEKSLCLLKVPIFHRMRSFNVIQLVDFLLTNFTDYYTERLLDAANGRLIRNMSRNIPILIDIQTIQKVDDYLYFVPSLKVPCVNYAVNTEILACTCLKNNTGYICFHIGWLLTMAVPGQEIIEQFNLKQIFHVTATGRFLQENTLTTIKEDVRNTELANTEKEDIQSEVLEQVIIVDGKEVIRLEIVPDEDQTKDSEVEFSELFTGLTDITGFITSESEAIAEGKKIIGELSNSLNTILEQCPFKIVPALQKVLIQTNSMSNIQQFILACESYAGSNTT